MKCSSEYEKHRIEPQRTIYPLTIGISSGFLSERIERISILKEWEPDCKNRNVKIPLLILPVQQGKSRAGILSQKSSLPTILSDSKSELRVARVFSLIDEVLDKELVNGSKFFLTKDFEEIVGLRFPPNFHTPFAPFCFHSP
jgi:hypothetical protein